jgi:hypothetical protein
MVMVRLSAKKCLYKKVLNIRCLLFQEENSFISEDGVNSCDSFMTADAANHSPSADRSTGSSSARKKEGESKSNGRILYCAPTGKAASVIKKRVGKKAFTIHQVWIVSLCPCSYTDSHEFVDFCGLIFNVKTMFNLYLQVISTLCLNLDLVFATVGFFKSRISSGL